MDVGCQEKEWTVKMTKIPCISLKFSSPRYQLLIDFYLNSLSFVLRFPAPQRQGEFLMTKTYSSLCDDESLCFILAHLSAHIFKMYSVILE